MVSMAVAAEESTSRSAMLEHSTAWRVAEVQSRRWRGSGSLLAAAVRTPCSPETEG